MRDLKAIVDPGAGRSYLCTGSKDCVLPTKEIMRWARLADGSKTSIVKAAVVQVCLRFQDGKSVSVGPMEVGLLPTGSESSASMLIGRDIGKIIGLRVDLATGQVTCEASGDICLEETMDQDTIDLIRYMETDVWPHVAGTGSGLVTLPSTEDLAGARVKPRLSEYSLAAVDRVVESLTGKGPLQVEALPGYTIEFKPLRGEESRDVEDQRAAVFADLPEGNGQPIKIPRYEKPAFAKLSDKEKSTYRRLVSEFVDRGWWEAESLGQQQGVIYLPHSPAFLAQRERKPRIVLDCRGVNSFLGKVSAAARTAPMEIIASTRMMGGFILTGDLEKAYYVCRLLRHKVKIAGAEANYESSRLAFGLNGGAGVLQAAVQEISEEVSKEIKNPNTLPVDPMAILVMLWYMDDLSLQGYSIQKLVAAFAFVCAVMLRFGFGMQVKKLWALVPLTKVTAFQEACREHGLDIPRVQEGTFLGTGVSITETELIVDCRAADKWAKVEDYLDREETQRTKAGAFSAAGAWGHDPVAGHPRRRLQADLLRAITGKVYSSIGWHEKFPPGAMSEEVTVAYEEVLHWIRTDQQEGPCLHRSTLGTTGNGSITLILETDASLLGWGFCLWATRQDGHTTFKEGDFFEVLSAAGRWNHRQSCYHSNRRELTALLEGLQRTLRVVETWWRASEGRIGCNIHLRVDNSATGSWGQGRKPSRALEVRAIVRLADAVKGEITHLRQLGGGIKIELQHLKGTENARSDGLSRLLERPCRNGKQLGRVLQEHLDGPLSAAFEYDDFICRVGELDPAHTLGMEDSIKYFPDATEVVAEKHKGDETEPIAERIAGQVWDIEGLLELWKAIRFCWTYWKTVTKNQNAPANYPMNYSSEDEASMIRSLQTAVWTDKEREALALENRFELSGSDSSLTLQYRCPETDGSVRHCYYVPKPFRLVRGLLVRTCHRGCGHGTTLVTKERVYQAGYFSPSLTRLVRDEVSTCIICQRLSAKRRRDQPLGVAGPSAVSSELSYEKLVEMKRPPYYVTAVDVIKLSSDPSLTYLSCYCLQTRHACWIALNSMEADELAAAVKRAHLREGGFNYIIADGAVLTRGFCDEVRRDVGSETIPIDARAPWCSGVETHHRFALRIGRVLLSRQYRGVTNWSLTAKQDLADELMWHINHRPLGRADISVDGEILTLTPDHLRYGYIREGKHCRGAEFSLDSIGPRRQSFVKTFLSLYWPLQRRENVGTRFAKAGSGYQAGDAVMIYLPRSKGAPSWRCGWVIRRLSSRRYRILWTDGQGHRRERITNENHFNLLPLKIRGLANEGGGLVDNGPSFVGRRLKVRVDHDDGSNDWYHCTVMHHRDGQIDGKPRVLVAWDNLEPGFSAREWLCLDDEVWIDERTDADDTMAEDAVAQQEGPCPDPAL